MCLSEKEKFTLASLWYLQPGWKPSTEGALTYPNSRSWLWEHPKNRQFQRVIFLVIRFVLLNGKRALDRWNQEELLQTPKNREAHNILNICHTRRASRVNSCAHKHERAGPEPLAATPAQQHGHTSHFCCQENHPAQVNTWVWPWCCHRSLTTSGYRTKTPNHGTLNLNVVGEEDGYLLSFSPFPFCHLGSWYFTSFPCWKAKITLLFYTRCTSMGVLKQLKFPNNLSLRGALSKQNIKQGSARPPLPFPHPHSSKKHHSHRWQVAWRQVSVTETHRAGSPFQNAFPKLDLRAPS